MTDASSFKLKPRDSGWVAPELRDYGVEKEVQKVMQDASVMTSDATPILGSWDGEDVRHDQILEKIHGSYPVVRQGIGDCVSFGWAKAIMATAACDILVRGENEQWMGKEMCTEWIYGTSRVLVGKGRLGNSDGSVGSWAAKAVLEHGTLLRSEYQSGRDRYDLRHYDPSRAESWGYRGLPAKELEPTADEHPVSSKPSLVTTAEEAADALLNGYSIAACSDQGFDDERDKDGFAKARGTWHHCMSVVGIVVVGTRVGFIVDNSSWGNWISGPNPHNLPIGCFLAEWKDIDRMMKQSDSFAIPGYKGFERRTLNWRLF